MELIQHEGLEEVSLFLTDLVVGSYRLNGTVEAFTSRYRKPAKIGRRKRVEGEKKGRNNHSNSNNHKRGGHSSEGTVPSYLKTGLLVDCESGSSTGPSPISLPAMSISGSESDCATPSPSGPANSSSSSSEAFAASLSFSAQEVGQPIGSTVFVAPRRQRSFSLTSCYAMRKHGRRRSSSLDNLSEPSSRLLLLDMVAALSDAFPDYDFADTKKEQFREMDLGVVVRHVNSCLTELMLRDPDAVVRLWRAIDEVVNLKHCEIFHYVPKEDEDADNFLWTFHFFFFNKDSHTLCYFACNAERYVCR